MWPRLIIDEPNFTISDDDVRVWIPGTPAIELSVVKDPIWLYDVINETTSDGVAVPIRPKVVQDSTLATGELQLIFGNENFGYNIENNPIDVVYAKTNGTKARNFILGDSAVNLSNLVNNSNGGSRITAVTLDDTLFPTNTPTVITSIFDHVTITGVFAIWSYSR